MRLLHDGAELIQWTVLVGSRTALMYRLFIIFPSAEPCSGDTSHPLLLECTSPDTNQWEQLLFLLHLLTISQRYTVEVLLEEDTGTADIDLPKYEY